MRLAKIKFHKLDKEFFFLPEFSSDHRSQIKIGEQVIVDTAMGRDLGELLDIAEYSDVEVEKIRTSQAKSLGDLKGLTCLASASDVEKAKSHQVSYAKYLKDAREMCQKHKLKEMKLVDVSLSLDGTRLTIYFISNTRVDFRDLVKDMAAIFHKKIRLQQIGVRDAAKIGGDWGPCGLPLCCKSWLSSIGKVNPDSIKKQELMHRGVDRLTGVCGRLKCCLRFEEDQHRWTEGKAPNIGDTIQIKTGQAKVVAIYPDKKTVDLEVDGAVVEYPYTEGNKCKADCQTGCSSDCK
jgi:cell fate regulator YaaT (PSP1 superfamily)